MTSRALLLAAVAALVSAQGLLPCVNTDTCSECCPPDRRLEVGTDGKAYCIDRLDPSTMCALCTNTPCADTEGFILTAGGLGLGGSTTGGGLSVGSFLKNPMRGFVGVPSKVPNLAGSMFDKFPDWQLGARATRYEVRTEGLRIAYECPKMLQYPGVVACDAFLFVFRCHPCRADNSGTLHAYLTQKGWKAHHCGPVFKFPQDSAIGENAHEHRFITYHKETTGEEVLDLDFALDFILAAVGPKAEPCGSHITSYNCNAAASCSWNDDLGSCETGWCPKRHDYWGPSTGCTVCPRNDDGTYNFDLA